MWNNSDRGKGAITSSVATAALVASQRPFKPLQVVVLSTTPKPLYAVQAEKAR